MPLRKAARILAGLILLFLVYALVRQLPVLRWIVEGAKLLHGAGLSGALFTALAIYLLTLLLLPIVPLIVACGWLYGMPGGLLSLLAAVASAASAASRDRKSTRLNSSHQIISYSVFCFKKKNKNKQRI